MKPQKVKKVYKTISKRAASLLRRDEGVDVDWKFNEKFDHEDIVAFANAPDGGAILLGVAEGKGPNNRQVSKIQGCDVSDTTKLIILGRAGDCSPPIHVNLYIENADTRPFWRIEIPTGNHKPYCTKKGIYKIRGDGKNNPLLPDELLALYLQEQGTRFNESFKRATLEINQLLRGMDKQVSDDLVDLHNNIEKLRVNFQMKLFDITHDFERSIEQANDQLTSAISTIPGEITSTIETYTTESGDSILANMGSLENSLESVDQQVAIVRAGIDELLRHNSLDDSATLYWRQHVYKHIDMFNLSNDVLRKGGTGLMSFDDHFKALRSALSGCPRDLLVSLVKERLPDFVPPARKKK